MRALLRREFGQDSRFLEEMVLSTERAPRIDLAVVNGALHGFEIKSDVDTLRRLETQLPAYGAVFDYLSIVVGLRYMESCKNCIPDWWGLYLVTTQSGYPRVKCVRKPSRNKGISAYALIRLLRRSELENLIRQIGFSGSVRKLECFEMEQMALQISVKTIQEHVRHSLRTRLDWKAAQPRSEDGDSFQPPSILLSR